MLGVEFAGKHGINCGRAGREFFTMDWQQLFLQPSNMFQIVREKFYWFKVNSFEARETHEILKMLVGLAGFNQNSSRSGS
jgi:hypothetical protein